LKFHLKEDETTEVLKSVRPLSSALPETTTNIHSSSEVAADNLKAEFNKALDEHSVPTSTTDNVDFCFKNVINL
jgi:hypothetical protein